MLWTVKSSADRVTCEYNSRYRVLAIMSGAMAYPRLLNHSYHGNSRKSFDPILLLNIKRNEYFNRTQAHLCERQLVAHLRSKKAVVKQFTSQVKMQKDMGFFSIDDHICPTEMQ